MELGYFCRGIRVGTCGTQAGLAAIFGGASVAAAGTGTTARGQGIAPYFAFEAQQAHRLSFDPSGSGPSAGSTARSRFTTCSFSFTIGVLFMTIEAAR
jgi:hypothetical protein